MYMSFGILTFIASLALAAGPTRLRAEEPCAVVATAFGLQSAGPYTVDAEVALACLRSVPLDKQNNTALLKAYRGVAQFQSNLAYLKNPLPGALYPAADILAGLDDIQTKLASDHYTNEYDFQFDIWSIAASTYDFHFVYSLDILTVFRWQREEALVSLSSDGLQLPGVYVYSDVIKSLNDSSQQPQSINKINDVDVEAWLNGYALMAPFGHDPDANYNNVLWSPGQISKGDPTGNGSFAIAFRPQGSLTKLTFADGTDRNVYTYAASDKNFTGITNGKDFFERFCTGEKASPDVSIPTESNPDTTTSSTTSETASSTYISFTSVSTQTTATPLTTIFPSPLVLTPDYSLAGYLPDELSDTAILQIPTFDPKQYMLDFQNSVRGLLATAQTQGRKKLIVDLRGNGGGSVFLGWDTFLQIFPSIQPFGGANLRSTALLRNITGALFDYHTNPGAQSTTQSPLLQQFQNETTYSPFKIYNDLNEANQSWTSAQDFYGPFHRYDDDFTNVIRGNAGNSYGQATSVHGYGSNTLPIPQVFQPEDVVLLQDGMCGSTCAVFSELMKAQGQVKTIAVGGRKQDGPMQGVGATKGSEVNTFADIAFASNAAADAANATTKDFLQHELADIVPGALVLSARSSDGKGVSINLRNNLRQGDDTYTPLQHVYEAADCRFFYTAAMLPKQVLVYKMVHDIHWGNASCIAGSAGHPSSLSGKLTSYIDAYPPTGANYTFGATEKVWPSSVSNPASKSSTAVVPIAAATTGPSTLDPSATYQGSTTAASPTSSPSKTAQAGGSSSFRYASTGLESFLAAVFVLHLVVV